MGEKKFLIWLIPWFNIPEKAPSTQHVAP